MKDYYYFRFWAPSCTAILNIEIDVSFLQFNKVSSTAFSDRPQKVKFYHWNRHLSTVTDKTLFPLPVLTAIFVYM